MGKSLAYAHASSCFVLLHYRTYARDGLQDCIQLYSLLEYVAALTRYCFMLWLHFAGQSS